MDLWMGQVYTTRPVPSHPHSTLLCHRASSGPHLVSCRCLDVFCNLLDPTPLRAEWTIDRNSVLEVTDSKGLVVDDRNGRCSNTKPSATRIPTRSPLITQLKRTREGGREVEV